MKPSSPCCRYRFIQDDRSPSAVQPLICQSSFVRGKNISYSLYWSRSRWWFLLTVFQNRIVIWKKTYPNNPSAIHKFVASSSAIITKYNRGQPKNKKGRIRNGQTTFDNRILHERRCFEKVSNWLLLFDFGPQLNFHSLPVPYTNLT